MKSNESSCLSDLHSNPKLEEVGAFCFSAIAGMASGIMQLLGVILPVNDRNKKRTAI